MSFKPFIIFILLFQLFFGLAYAQDNVANKDNESASDSIEVSSSDSLLFKKNEFSLRKDTFELPKTTDTFVPNSTKAVWYSAIFPGLGQIYNKKYWKLPIIYGSFVGIAYGLSFNQRNYTDYALAYKDAMDDNVNTKSYENFVPASWSMKQIQDVMKRKKDYYRRYRDLSIIGMVAMYAACMIDAYVDAELYSFDISPDLSLHVEPAVIQTSSSYANVFSGSALGLQCHINF